MSAWKCKTCGHQYDGPQRPCSRCSKPEHSLAAPTGSAKCLNPSCTRQKKYRGLCEACYQVANRLIREKLTTWQDLYSAGKCERAQTRGAKGASKAMAWFLSPNAELSNRAADKQQP